MRRRTFLALVAGSTLFAFARAGAAASGTPVVVGLLSPFTRAETEPWHEAFRQGLRERGWTEERDVKFEYRYTDGHAERLPELIAGLLRLNPAVIVTSVTTDSLPAAKATRSVPIVMASPGDPVSVGLIASLAHPGGNVTGLTQMATDLAAKRLQLLKEVAPAISRVGVLRDVQDSIGTLSWRDLQEPAGRLGITLHSLEVRRGDDLEGALARALEAHDEALLPLPTPIFVVAEKRIAEFAVAHRMPSMYHLPEFVRLGGLMSYGPDRADLFRRAATYVDKILKGANPGELPVEQASKFQLVVNLKTAKALGVTVPSALLARADEVIE